MSELRILFTTTPPADAPAIVRTLVEENLVACGNMIPGVRSIYRWQGELCDDAETVVIMETTAERLPAAQDRLRALHPYTCPKIVVLTPADVNDDYLAWAHAQLKDR